MFIQYGNNSVLYKNCDAFIPAINEKTDTKLHFNKNIGIDWWCFVICNLLICIFDARWFQPYFMPWITFSFYGFLVFIIYCYYSVTVIIEKEMDHKSIKISESI